MKSKYDVVIVAGGFGSRMGLITNSKPKPMIRINKTPTIGHQVEQCRLNGFNNILILTHYLPQKIINFFNKNKKADLNIDFHTEKKPRGTAGAIYDVVDKLEDNFLIIYGDIFFDINLRKFFDFHINKFSSITPLVHPNDHPHDSDLVSISKDGVILSINCYPHSVNFYSRNLVSSGLFVASKDIFAIKDMNWLKKIEISRDLMPKILKSNKFNAYAYVSREYAKDMGTLERLKAVRNDVVKNKPKLLSIDSRSPAIFLDRDGTIIDDVNYLNKIEQIKFINNSISAIKQINNAAHAAIVITNQPIIARGELSLNKLEDIHSYIEYQVGKFGAYFDSIYYCPHHPDTGYKGEIKEFKVNCKCRKPNTLLSKKAIKKFNIDISLSWMIGDTTTDVLFGKNNNIKTILLRTGKKGLDGKYNVLPDFICYDLKEATNFIFKSYSKISSSFLLFLEKNKLKRFTFVGGKSQSGKSTFCSVLQNTYAKNKIHIINIDGFLKINHSSINNDVVDNYDLKKIDKIINYLTNNHAGRIQIPIYNRFKKNSFSKKIISYSENDLFLFEGTIMLTIFKNLNAIRFYIETSEYLRKKRFKKEYSWRGLSKYQILKKFNSRTSEFEFIKNNSKFDYIYRMDTYDFS